MAGHVQTWKSTGLSGRLGRPVFQMIEPVAESAWDRCTRHIVLVGPNQHSLNVSELQCCRRECVSTSSCIPPTHIACMDPVTHFDGARADSAMQSERARHSITAVGPKKPDVVRSLIPLSL